MCEGWKEISGYISNALGRNISAEAARQLARREPDLKRRLIWFSGRPGIPRHDLDTWLAMYTMPAKKRKMAAMIDWVSRQLWLGLF